MWQDKQTKQFSRVLPLFETLHHSAGEEFGNFLVVLFGKDFGCGTAIGKLEAEGLNHVNEKASIHMQQKM